MYDNAILEKILTHHGGLEQWSRCDRISFELRSGGFAFLTKGQQNALINKHVNIYIKEQRVTLQSFPIRDQVGEWTYDRVRILDSVEQTVSERQNPRAAFFRSGRPFRWDALDMLYFVGYALWNYLTFPFLLCAEGVQIQKTTSYGNGAILDVEFPANFPTHCRQQVFHVDARGKLIRHDYTAEIIGSWAQASNFCLESEESAGLLFYTRRRVLPRIGSMVIPTPTLVWIELTDIVAHKFQDTAVQDLIANQKRFKTLSCLFPLCQSLGGDHE